MAVKKELRRWNYQQYRKMGYSPREANNLKNRSIEKTWVEIREHRQWQHRKGKEIMPYPSIPEKAVAPKVRNEKEKFWRELGFSEKQSKRMKYHTWQSFFAQKARLKGFQKAMGKKGINWREAIKEILSNLDDTYSLSEFFRAFRAWYEKNIGIRP
jgi:hypothetical protein